MRIIGLTGGIASGKSTVAKVMERFGVPVIDADQLARDVVAVDTPGYDEVVSAFGSEIVMPDRTINRTLLGNMIFSDIEKRRRLESITHPAIRKAAEERLSSLEREGKPLAVYMAPLLIEAGAASRVDEIWLVYLDEEQQITRLMARDGISREDALKRIGSQMPLAEKRKLSTIVIDNSGSLAETERQVEGILQQIMREVAT